MNDRKLIDYLPLVLRSVMEFMAITDAQQPEIERAWDALKLVMNNQFIDTATEEGVAVWEKELNIIPLNTDTLDERKHRIKTAWTYGVVYTYNWLTSWVKTSCGENNQLPAINEYTLRVALPVSVDYIKILDVMRRYVSANVLINPLILLTKMNMKHGISTAVRFSIKQSMKTPEINIILLADESGNLLADEENKILYEEGTV